MTDPVFVFGSNLQGRHGKGAALWAVQHRGAIPGCGGGRQGNAYGIPTKRTPWETLPLNEVHCHVLVFLGYARAHPDLQFQVTPIGCGLAGFTPAQIAPMFRDAPPNCILPDEFRAVLE
ncbi:A1S_2505 family phage non-structural protein [Kaistia sp. MMO-174]|uniref:A1S_2505 family phage non-structural protein n=1 Tax=Kaistia sp. MMO-174 TaxID=3081256 RepID=UPI0030197023